MKQAFFSLRTELWNCDSSHSKWIRHLISSRGTSHLTTAGTFHDHHKHDSMRALQRGWDRTRKVKDDLTDRTERRSATSQMNHMADERNSRDPPSDRLGTSIACRLRTTTATSAAGAAAASSTASSTSSTRGSLERT